MVNREAYEKLVKDVYKNQHNSIGEKAELFNWFDPCQEINLWTYWQGKDSKDVKIMVVGQDWGNPYHSKNKQTIDNIVEGRNYFYGQSGKMYPTDISLSILFEIIGYKDIINNRYDDLFFTNFYLKYRADGCKETGGMSRKNMMRDAMNFVDLIAAIQPKVIICLGKLTYECVIDALKPDGKCRIGKISDYCNLIDNGNNFTDIADVRVFGMVHCGASGINVNRKKGLKTDKSKTGLELMLQDWQAVKSYLESKNVSLNLDPVE